MAPKACPKCGSVDTAKTHALNLLNNNVDYFWLCWSCDYTWIEEPFTRVEDLREESGCEST